MAHSDAHGNVRLRTLLVEAGWTHEAAARAVVRVARESGRDLRANRSSITHWLHGVVPALRTRGYLAEAFSRRLGRVVTIPDLGMPGEDDDERLGLELTGRPESTVGRLAAADLDRRSFLSTAAYSVAALDSTLRVTGLPAAAALFTRGHVAARPSSSGTRWVGEADVDAVRQLTRAFTAQDELLGGEHGRGAVVTYLAEDVTALCGGSFRDERVHRSMFSAAAQVAYLAGWKAHDAGRESLAQRYYIQALGLAQEGDGDRHAAWVLRILAHHAMDIGRPERCVQLAEAAWTRGRGVVDHGTQALLALSVSRARGNVGDRSAALSWLAQGERLLARWDQGETPPWVGLTGAPETLVANHAAKTWTALGEPARAEPAHTAAMRGWSPDTHPRVRALTAADLAQAQAAQGHLEHACRTWAEALPVLVATRSARTRRAVAAMRASLAHPRVAGLPQARDLMTRSAG